MKAAIAIIFGMVLSPAGWSHSGLLAEKFSRLKGVRGEDLFAIVNRMDCTQRIYDGRGVAIDGDGSFKVNSVAGDLYELDVSASYTLSTSGDKFRIEEVDDSSDRRLVDVSAPRHRHPIVLNRRFQTHSRSEPDGLLTEGWVEARTELRVLQGGSPPTLILRETVLGVSVVQEVLKGPARRFCYGSLCQRSDAERLELPVRDIYLICR